MKPRILSPVFLLALWGILLRLLVYLLLPAAKEMAQYPQGDMLFFSALTDHFPEYLRFTSQIPPASFLINAAVLFVFGIKTALHIRAFLLLVFLMDITAVTFLFRAAKKMGANQSLAFLILLLFSTALVPFELWREGMHYDHHTIFFTSLFAWSLVKMIREEGKWQNLFWVSLTGGLLVTQSAANSLIVPVSVLLILLLVHIPRKQYRKFFVNSFVTLLLPVLALAIISRKNQKEGNESLTSNKGGPAMMMVVQKAYNYDVAKVRSVIQNSGAPEWYLWTYDHATVPTDPFTGNGYDGWINLAQAFGICFFDAPSEFNTPWSFNFHPLLNHLRQNHLTALVKTVETDSANAVSKPYLFAGYSPELAPGWIAVYGDVSKKIFFYTLLNNPLGMGKAILSQQAVFALYGPLFPYNTTQAKHSLLAYAGLRTVSSPLPLYVLFLAATLIFALLAVTAYLIILCNIPLAVLWFLKIVKSGNTLQPVSAFTLLSIPALGIALIFSCLVGGENDRYFMQATPYIIILMTCLPAWFADLLPKK